MISDYNCFLCYSSFNLIKKFSDFFFSCDISSQTNTSMSVPQRRPIRRRTTWRYVANILADTEYYCVYSKTLTANTLKMNSVPYSPLFNKILSLLLPPPSIKRFALWPPVNYVMSEILNSITLGIHNYSTYLILCKSFF